MQSFNSPPIPSPDGSSAIPPSPVAPRGDWATAPAVVKNWAYQLTWLLMLFFIVMIGVSIFGENAAIEKVLTAIFFTLLFGVSIWLNRALKNGAKAAWVVQIIFSAVGITGFPIGTLIHGYILSQWFKPETKAWFGMS